MDTCIAKSIQQRTAYLFNTLEHMQEKQTDFGSFSAVTPGRTMAESETRETGMEVCQSQPAPQSRHNMARVMSRPAPLVKAKNTGPKPGATSSSTAAAKSRGLTSAEEGKRCSTRSYQYQHPGLGCSVRSHHYHNPSQTFPPAETAPHWYTSTGPLYDTLYSPRCYQPMKTFHIPATEPIAKIRSTNNVILSRRYGLDPALNYTGVGRGLAASLGEATAPAVMATRVYGHAGDATTLSRSWLYSEMGSPSLYTDLCQHGSGAASPRLAVNFKHSKTNASNKKPHPQKSKSHAAHQCIDKQGIPQAQRASRPGQQGQQRQQGNTVVKKSTCSNPDLNNNFYKGGSGIFFCNRIKGLTEDEEMSGTDRISLLAQPKRYPCQYRNFCDVKRITPEAMQRIESLAQPKLCHYTVCSCCLSPNCLGECTTKFKPNVSSCSKPSCVDWDRLATPRKTVAPPVKVTKPVQSSALTASTNRRIEKLSVPRKQINSGDYYVWLWNKKPDVNVYLKPIRRLSVAKCDLKDTRVLLRCDLDFTRGKPIDCKVRDALPTMQLALKREVKSIVIISRCGPEGIPKDPAFSLKPLAQVFEKYLETRVIFLDDCVGFQAQALCEDPVPGSVFLLENLSFSPEEVGYVMQGDQKILCKKEDVNRYQKIISDHGDIYITDSFCELVNMTNTTVGYPPKVHSGHVKK
ncbi:phosphoglycerate kinase [Elysia marginata]|uniref:Phosphoglycerate kinase n=1 Tax=Elysia marginata TaxID=1093978 RepID=A0AAV4ES47_9GAST|nr:phosphoglycerate kinase [Elysia marginata]